MGPFFISCEKDTETVLKKYVKKFTIASIFFASVEL